ncbi:LysM peptidoglycan-binding domain-containing protein [Paenibacillus agricola]|uniref:LysM peptidoglycan-binding domain-containing protein n=1 Tax=Paenibacillus agricola TaxID=2716264 RepID=A0ABX0J383_9BACL|nr:LysM peptidoglycan-binding domain-containing protein [Paenibacillus agricola]NHN30749.1 LysM peptidoglycan-binding domain-containing protein [Paenibacillus agricola]
MYMNEQLLSKPEPTSFPRFFTFSLSRKKQARIIGVFAAILLILVITLSLSLIGAEQEVYASSELPLTAQTVEIVKGDTLWAIASEHVHKGQKIREYLDQLKKMNGLTSSVIQEGQILKLP